MILILQLWLKLSPETCVDQLAPLGCAVLTGWGAAESVAKVTQDDKVKIHSIQILFLFVRFYTYLQMICDIKIQLQL